MRNHPAPRQARAIRAWSIDLLAGLLTVAFIISTFTVLGALQ